MQKFKKAKKEKVHSKLNGFFISGVIALVLTLVAYGILVFAENAVLGKYDKVTVYTASTDIEQGTPLTADMFTSQLVDRRIVPSDALPETTSFETVVAQYFANQKISKNGILCAKDITKTLDKVSGTHEVGISVKDVSSIANGVIRASDTVDIYILNGDRDNEPVFTNVFVVKAFSGNGTPIPNSDKVSVAQRFNVLLNEEEANRLIALMQTGQIVVVKVERDEE